MAGKVILALCASALIVNAFSAQCAGNVVNGGLSELNNNGVFGKGLSSGCGLAGLGYAGNGFGYGGNGYGFGANGLSPANLASSNGGSFTVSSTSPIAPSGLSVFSDNALEGPLTISGGVPFLGAVDLEGQVPASGASGVSYNCGNGNVGIISENVAPAGGVGIGSGLGAGLGGAGYGFGSPLAGRGVGGNFGAFGARGLGCGAGVY